MRHPALPAPTPTRKPPAPMRCALLVLLLATVAHAGSVTLSPGDDVQAAINAAAPGDVLTLTKGTYLGVLTIPAGKNGLVLKGKGPAVIDARPGGVASGPALTISSANVTIQGLTLRHAQAGTSGEGILAGSRTTLAKGLRLIKLSILNCEGPGITVTGDDLLVSGCTLQGNGAGIVVIGDRAQLEKTKVLDTDTYGIQVAGEDAVVTGCTVTTTGSTGGGVVVTGSRASVSKTTVENAGGVGLTVTGAGFSVSKNKVLDGRLAGLSVNQTDADPASLVDGNTVDTCDGAGIVATSVGGLTLSKNKVQHCGRSGSAAFILATDGTLVDKNTAQDNAHSGFRVAGNMNLLTGNTSRRNLVDGFTILSGSVNTLDGNKALDNAGEGFQNDDGVDPPVVNTALRNAKAKGNRRDVAVFTAFAVFDKVSFETGGNNPSNPGDQPEIDD